MPDLGAVSERAVALSKPTHVVPGGGVAMVDVSGKSDSQRYARAEAFVKMSPSVRRALEESASPKGDAFTVAQLAGIMAAKRTATLIPLAHPVPLSHVEVSLAWMASDRLRIESLARTVAATGVEMEALVAAGIAALTIYDMIKSLDRSVTVETVRLLEKSGGKSGHWRLGDEAAPPDV